MFHIITIRRKIEKAPCAELAHSEINHQWISIFETLNVPQETVAPVVKNQSLHQPI
jgi:hypothetical protein